MTVITTGRARGPVAYEELVTPAEAVRLTGKPRRTINRAADDGFIREVRTLGNHRRFARADLIAHFAPPPTGTVTGRMTPRRTAPPGHRCQLTIWGLPDGRFRVICEPCTEAGLRSSWTFEGGKDIRRLRRLYAQHTGAVS